MDNLIIDGFNLAFRCHFSHAVLSTSKGLQSGCVYGFLVALRSIKNKYPQCHITIAWDSDSTRRKTVYAEYKATRPKFILGEQISDLMACLKGINVDQAMYIGEEGDDVIASLTKFLNGVKYIYTADKDLLQLVRDGKALVIRPKTSTGPERIYDEEAVKREFGVAPQDLACYMSLRGDTVDNVPGIPRVTSSVLAALSTTYKNPWAIYKHLSEVTLTDFQRRSIIAFEQQAYLNYQLVSLRDDLRLEISKGSPNSTLLEKCLNKYEIRSINPNTYMNIFVDKPSNVRTGPAIISYSLFEEEQA
jgi:DNA polymerase-1